MKADKFAQKRDEAKGGPRHRLSRKDDSSFRQRDVGEILTVHDHTMSIATAEKGILTVFQHVRSAHGHEIRPLADGGL